MFALRVNSGTRRCDVHVLDAIDYRRGSPSFGPCQTNSPVQREFVEVGGRLANSYRLKARKEKPPEGGSKFKHDGRVSGGH
jgi:hypothetical protein